MSNTKKARNAVTILIAEDDEDDRELIKDAFKECNLPSKYLFVNDGEEVMDYLLRKEKYRDENKFPSPALILLDLNMPRKDGRQTLMEIKAHSDLQKTPVIILTTSRSEDDVQWSYKTGVSSFIIKPVTFTAFVEVTRSIGKYWLEIVELPK